MKKIQIAALCAAVLLALAAPAAAWADVSADAWYAPAVEFCQREGLMDGMGADAFVPGGAVTRGQLVTTLWRLAGRPAAPGADFADVSADAWYAPAVAWAVDAGVTDGVGGGNFDPDGALTREQLAAFLYRFAGRPEAAGASGFADAGAIAPWAADAADWARSAGVMQGRGEGQFQPQGGAVRAELAQVLKNFVEKVLRAPRALPLSEGVRPVGAAVEAGGAVIVTDAGGFGLWRVTDTGCTLLAGGAEGYRDGKAAQAAFASPWGVAPFLGGWAVSDPENDAVRLVRGGAVESLNGLGFAAPTGLAADDAGNLYVACTGSGTVWRVTPTGQKSVAAEGLDGPTGLAWADGALYVAETEGGRVKRIADGVTETLAAIDGATGLAVAEDGTVFAAATAQGAVYRIAPDGAVRAVVAAAEDPETAPWPAAPVGLALRGGEVLICDRFAGTLTAVQVG